MKAELRFFAIMALLVLFCYGYFNILDFVPIKKYEQLNAWIKAAKKPIVVRKGLNPIGIKDYTLISADHTIYGISNSELNLPDTIK